MLFGCFFSTVSFGGCSSAESSAGGGGSGGGASVHHGNQNVEIVYQIRFGSCNFVYRNDLQPSCKVCAKKTKTKNKTKKNSSSSSNTGALTLVCQCYFVVWLCCI